MGKRSDFKRRKADRYFTPPEAVMPLLSYLGDVRGYAEPCVGKHHLCEAIYGFTSMAPIWTSDLPCDATSYDYIARWGLDHLGPNGEDRIISHFITNPPWTRQILHPIIENLSSQLPTWLLFDAPWMHTKQAIPYLKRCRKIVSVGRVSWMQNGTSSMDDCCWYLFDKGEYKTEFVSR